VYVEPFVLFNFGSTDTPLPGTGSPNVLATHVYALDAAANGSVMDRSVAAAERDGAPVVVTEWGDSNDPAVLNPFSDQFDARLLPWLYWSWNGHVVMDSNQPLVPPNLDLFALAALARPYPLVTNGTPTHLTFDETTTTMDFGYSTTRPNGHPASHWSQTVITVPELRYPRGYTVTAVGAEVTSRPCARTVTLRNRPGAAAVSVHLAPANATCHH
jgi:endoglycosylceramidase